MYLTELQTIVFSLIQIDDPYRKIKEIHLKNWCRAFLILFTHAGQGYLPFFLDVLSDENCWEKTNTIHGIKLNRRTVAKKMVELKSWKGTRNPLDDTRRYYVACWCCLKEDIFNLFEQFKQESRIKNNDAVSVKRLVKRLSSDKFDSLTFDALAEFWSHVMGECATDLPLEGMHPFEYGLYKSLSVRRVFTESFTGYIEAVEFFWNRIQLLDEKELSFEQKYEIFMKSTVRAASHYCHDHPEIFEFCIGQLSVDWYPEFLKREMDISYQYCSSFNLLHEMLSFDKFRLLFDCLQPNDVSENMYRGLLVSLVIEDYSEHFAIEVLNLCLHMWRKEGFEIHRAFVLRIELSTELSTVNEGVTFCFNLVKKHYMELLWAVLDVASPDEINELMKSKEACYIRSELQIREDLDSLNKFSSYQSSTNGRGC